MLFPRTILHCIASSRPIPTTRTWLDSLVFSISFQGPRALWSAPRHGATTVLTHPDDHTIRTTDTPGFKPFTMTRSSGIVNNLVPRAHVSFGQRHDTESVSWCWPKDTWALGTRLWFPLRILRIQAALCISPHALPQNGSTVPTTLIIFCSVHPPAESEAKGL